MLELQERNSHLQERIAGRSNALTSLEGSSTLFSELQMSGLAQAMSVESLDEPGAVKIGQQVRVVMCRCYVWLCGCTENVNLFVLYQAQVRGFGTRLINLDPI